MPAPHWLPSFGQAHSPCSDHWSGRWDACRTGREYLALDFRRAVSWAGVKLPLTERISPAMPETMGAEKLVPKFGFVSLVSHWPSER